jgi:hypothetical protein
VKTYTPPYLADGVLGLTLKDVAKDLKVPHKKLLKDIEEKEEQSSLVRKKQEREVKENSSYSYNKVTYTYFLPIKDLMTFVIPYLTRGSQIYLVMLNQARESFEKGEYDGIF